ncbi:hypothetical protein ACE1ET_03440 [Saccharicrinis sp. FJH62]|uniref:hypothetical protein n=1 Tax=Saccharicrinis sp. FJH62 TaxID=3344657 RepID=UPI0035D4EC7C
MKQKLQLLFLGLVLIQLSSAENNPLVSIVPFTISQNGQIIIKACLNNKEFPARFCVETNGKNLLRSDKEDRLNYYNLHSDLEVTNIDTLVIGSCHFFNCSFRIANRLEKRGEFAFPDSILGTIGPELFKDKILQIDYAQKVIKISTSLDALNIPDSAFKIEFRDDRKSAGINLELQTKDFGSYDIAVDTRSPLGIHLFYSDLPSSQRKKHKDNFKHCAVKLDGVHNKTFVYYEPEIMSLNKLIQINNQPVWFSDFIPNSIGNAFLNQFRITLDFKEHLLYLEPITYKGKQMLSPL